MLADGCLLCLLTSFYACWMETTQSLGGAARKAALTPEQRQEIARKAATARWDQNPNKLAPTDRNTQIDALFADIEDTLRNSYTSFSATETKAFAYLLNKLRDRILDLP